jgi:flagellar biosynthesis chaperone FliJ
MKPIEESKPTGDRYSGVEKLLANVEGKLREFDRKTQELTGKVQLKAHLGMMDAETVWDKSKKELQSAIDQLRDVQGRPKAALDQAREELNSGIKDAEAAIAKLRKKVGTTQNHASNLASAARDDAGSALKRIRGAFASIKSKLTH